MSSEPIVQVNFRMPASLKARLESAAAASHRTVTAELVARLEGSFTTEETQFAELKTKTEELLETTFHRALKKAITEAIDEAKRK